MTLFKRHVRRVAGVGVGVALLVLGLEAPAFAATPTIASFSPGSGPVGCVVVITGTNFTNPTVSKVTFNTTDATDISVVSDTEIWATVPVGATDGQVHVTNASGTADSGAAMQFDVVSGSAGACAPTVTSFTPACALAGATVTLTGTNLLRSANPATTPTEVRFADYATTSPVDAAHTVPNADSPTKLSVIVPSGAQDGPIRVTTFITTGGQGFSTTQFQAPPPDCTTAGPTTHARSVTLRLSDSLNVAGNVKVGDGFAPCRSGVSVKVQRKVNGSWKTIRSATTTVTGKYAGHIGNKHGKYRALAPKVTRNSGADVCKKAVSPVRTH